MDYRYNTLWFRFVPARQVRREFRIAKSHSFITNLIKPIGLCKFTERNQRIVPRLIKLPSGIIFLLTLFLVMMACAAPGQSITKILNPPHKFKALNAPVVYSVLKDKKGFMWFTTQYGLIRYDGYNFKTYTNNPEDSTSIPNLFSLSKLFESRDGKIWIRTWQNLLIEFDPITEIFTSYPLDTLSSNIRNWMSAMYEDRNGNIWIGLQYEGFYRFNRKEKTFKLYRQQTEELIHDKDFILSFLELNDNHLLVGTGEGLYVLDLLNDSIYPFSRYYQLSLPTDFEKSSFTSLLKDRNGRIWIGSEMGLFAYDGKKQQLQHFEYDPDNYQSLSGNIIQHIYANPIDGGQTLWLIVWTGLSRSEINKIDINSGIVERYTSKDKIPTNVSDRYLDESGLLWIASENQGVFFIDLKNNPFHHFDVSVDVLGEEKYSGTAFYTDSKRDFWVGTGQGGLFKYDSSRKLLNRYVNLPGSLYNNFPTLVYSVFEDSRKDMWISYWADGLGRMDHLTGEFERYHFKYPLADIPYSGSSEVVEDSYGRIWAGTSNGPYYYEPSQEDSVHFTWVDTPLLGDYMIRSLCEDHSGAMWFTTQLNGLFCLTPENRDSLNFIQYTHNPKKAGSLSSNCVYNVHCSDRGTLWVGTNNGLNRFDPETKTFEWFNINNGFDTYFVFCVQTDQQENVWAITDKGLVRFNPDAGVGKKFKSFSEYDGLPITRIYPYHFDRDRDGKMYVGGIRGFGLGYFSFHPDSIKDNNRIPPVAITSFKVKNKAIALDTVISYKRQLNLGYNQNFISFEFASLDFNDPERNQYAYKLEGLDEDWFYSGNRHVANYTGLSPGSYVFRVKGSNNDGYWNEEGVNLAITISAPPWKTWWAYLLYMVFSLGVLSLILRYYVRRQQLLHRLELEHLESDKLKEIDSMKTRFFANISHEFRTPLTLILGPLQKMIGRPAGATDKRELTMMQRNAHRLQQLINQLLDISKLEAGKMQLQCSEMNIVEWVRMYIQSFESLSRQRKIDFVFEARQEEIRCRFDPEKMAQVLNNLLSNAFKFTGSGGRIVVEVGSPQSAVGSSQSTVVGSPQSTVQILEKPQTPPFPKGAGGIPTEEIPEESVQITVSDTGPGIPPEKLPHIFNRFYQADDAQTRKFEGTGIGLALVKELVELHHGSITVESTEGEGTTFTIALLLGKEHMKPEEIVSKPAETTLAEIPEKSPETGTLDETKEETVEADLPILLIVEDNADMRNYIRGFFTEKYKIIEAENGRQGLALAISHIPDIIVSDVMMPVMDGYQLCQKIKTDQRTSHIPLVLLTARSSGADKIEGLETGADDFVIKPFEGKELQVRVKNLVYQREKLREHFRKEFSLAGSFSHSGLPSLNQQFLQKALKIIDLHLSDADFSVEDFASQMAMSRVQLHRKIKAIADLSAGDFIRSFRLKKAAEMLQSKSDNITQIAFAVGFNNPSWFAECFKKQFGVLPSEYNRAHPHL